MRNGDEVEAKVTALNDTEVSYKKWSNQDGPTYTTAKSKIFMIKYQNGDKDVFKEEPAESLAPAPAQNAALTEIGKPDEARNSELIRMYNNDGLQYKEITEIHKGAEVVFGQYFVTEDSKLANKDVELYIYTLRGYYAGRDIAVADDPFACCSGTTDVDHHFVYVKVINRTDKPVYVDLANTFLSDNHNNASSYYVPSSTSTTKGKNGGVGVNLGGIAGVLGVGGAIGTIASGVNVGGGTSNSATTVTYAERIITIAPNSKKILERKVCNTLDQGITFHENVFPGKELAWTPESSPSHFKFYITYSIDEAFSSKEVLNSCFYLAKAFGARKLKRKYFDKTYDSFCIGKQVFINE